MTSALPDPPEAKPIQHQSQESRADLAPALPQVATSRPALVPGWRLWLPLFLQTVLILGVPAQAVYTHVTGRTVILRTIPVDPYDLLRGYYVTLSYDIAQVETLKKLPGWKTLAARSQSQDALPTNTPFYVILAAPADSSSQPPQPWKPVAVSPDLPKNLPANQIALKGQVKGYNWITYGLEEYYIPEDQRQEINAAIASAQSQQRREAQTSPIVVETKVDAQGRPILLSFWVTLGEGAGKRSYNYRF